MKRAGVIRAKRLLADGAGVEAAKAALTGALLSLRHSYATQLLLKGSDDHEAEFLAFVVHLHERVINLALGAPLSRSLIRSSALVSVRGAIRVVPEWR